ncbi:MFS transporter [Pseudonocardia sp. TRM90224]|uniref:MFS transporter n=1 Tax=Pseudonocardia sp. TRM90224 TaxID=2812678 RepID=UPI001E42A851|nr:MFS transporter [Pseudonocardia sp. TRM90224]
MSTALARNRRFVRFAAAMVVARIGTAMAPIALAAAVLDVDPAPTGLAVVLAATSVPQLLTVLLGGVLADRLPRGALLVGGSLVAGVVQSVVVVRVVTGAATVGRLAVLSAVFGAAAAFRMPIEQAVVPQLVAVHQVQRATALLRLPVNVIRIAAPAASGLILAFAGPAWSLAVDAAAHLVAAGLLVRLGLPRLGSGRSFLGDLADGWQVFRTTTWVWTYSVSGVVVVGLYLAGWVLLGPVAAARYYGGEHAWGVVQSGLGVGLVVGSVVALRLPMRRPMVVATIASTMFAAPLLAVGLEAPLVVVVAAAALTGIGLDVASVAWATALAEHLPAEQLGRINAWTQFGELSAVPLSYVLVGLVADTAGITVVLQVSAVLIVVGSLVLLAVPQVVKLGRAPVG